MALSVNTAVEKGLPEKIAQQIAALEGSPEEIWRTIRQDYLTPDIPFAAHEYLYDTLFADYDAAQDPKPAWSPDKAIIDNANITRAMQDNGHSSLEDFYHWSITDKEAFWDYSTRTLGIAFDTPYSQVLDISEGPHAPVWFPDATLNIAQSCFRADPNAPAIVYREEGSDALTTISFAELDGLSNRVAESLRKAGFSKGDRIAVCMPMTAGAVIAYLGIIRAGCAVVSIPDSFSPEEIAMRITLAEAKGVVTQDVSPRGEKTLPMFEKIVKAEAPRAIVFAANGKLQAELREGDLVWEDFLIKETAHVTVACAPDDCINVLFSSGTTGTPKVIPWNHTTAIKSGIDGFYHQDIKAGDVVAWPTNIGWMMGPWLIFAALLNRAAIALYYGAPMGEDFGRFVQDARVTMLGLVPSIVKAWREQDCMNGLDWSAIKVFSSTGECSSPDDYLYLMSRVQGYRPVIEYCGGTEIGGGYVSSTVIQPNAPSTFSTPVMGTQFYILNEQHKPCADNTPGEVYIVPPAMGLSTRLLGDKDHFTTYYKDTPKGPEGETLRRHGDEMIRLPGGYYAALGRADDTMNLGGIKVGSADIERVLNTVEGVKETAAIAINPKGGGPSELVVFTVLNQGVTTEKTPLQQALQQAIKTRLNPLFKIQDIVITNTLPRTASNKVMRRKLRDQYHTGT